MSPEQHFERELKIFRSDILSALQCLYAWLAIHRSFNENRDIRSAANATPLFWNTILGSLQVACFISMGRIFDEDPKNHSLVRMAGLILKHPEIFSRKSLAGRKKSSLNDKAFDHKQYASEASIFSKNDIARILRFVSKKKEIYKKSYQKIRHQVFAHNVHGDRARVEALFSQTKIRELELLLLSLNGLYEVLWQQFHNGRKVRVLSGKYSIDSILRTRGINRNSRPPHELISLEANALIRALPNVKRQLI